MSTRSAAKRQLRATRSSDNGQVRTSVRGARNAPSPSTNRRLQPEVSTSKASARKRPAIDEETKGRENDGDEDGPAQRRTRIDVEDDSVLLRALVAARERMESAPRKLVVWHEVGGGRFSHGRAVVARVRWLQQVFQDPEHPEYAKLTPEMRSLLKDWANESKPKDASEDEAAIPSPPKRQKVGEPEKEAPEPSKKVPEPNQKVGEPKKSVAEPTPERSRQVRRLSSTKGDEDVGKADTERSKASPVRLVAAKKPHRAAVFDSAVEEKLMQLVLDHADQFERAERKLDVWELISQGTDGQYTGAMNVKNHVWWIMRSLRDPNHRVAKEATPRLRELVDQYIAMNPNLSGGSLDKVSNKVKTAQKPPQETAQVVENAQRKAKEVKTIDAASDELLVRLVLENVSTLGDDETNSEHWRHIASAVQKKNPTITSRTEARARLQWLLRVLDDATHEQHIKLTAPLRESLMSYKANKVVPAKEPDQVVSIVSEPVEAPNRTSNEVVEENEDDEMNNEVVRGELGKGDTPRRTQPLVDPPSDELFLRHVLELRPFDADRASRGEVWARVVDATNNPRINSAGAAQTRLRWLYHVYQQPSHSDHGLLSEELKIMLKEYDEIYGEARAEEITQALGVPLDVSDDEDESMADPMDDIFIREMLRARPFHAKIGTGMVKWKEVASKVNRAAGMKVYTTGQSCLSRMKKLLAVARSNGDKYDIHLSKKQRAMLHFVDALLKVRWPTGRTDLTDGHRACLKKIQRLLDGSPVPKVTQRTKPPTPKQASTRLTTPKERLPVHFMYQRPPPAAGVDPIDALQQDILSFREAAAQDRNSREQRIAQLKEQVAECRSFLSDQVENWDDERREQRDELRTIMDLLKDHRDMHARESALVLQAVEKEREDRRQEFGTLMNLVTRAVLRRTRPSTNA